jgi:mono/diheme cytochrome c family protein
LPEAPAATVPLPEGVLAFDSDKKSENVREGDAQARFVFRFTNVSAKEVTISKVTTSCGCTTAELPPMPWKVAPGARGRIPVTMNVTGHMGKSAKTVTVSTLQGFVTLQVEANILSALAGAGMGGRERNQELAKADRQAVFKGGCAECHAATAEGKTGRALYAAVCGICHEASPRATMVPDLRALNHPTDYTFWKTMTAAGKPGTLMPAFAQDQGGPLTGAQIESLARALTNGLLSEIRVSPALSAGQGADPKTAARK